MTTARAPRKTGQPGRPGYDLDSLLAVAVKVFNDLGYDGTSMEILAKRLRSVPEPVLPADLSRAPRGGP